MVEKPRISPGFLAGLVRASNGNLVLHRRPGVLEKSNEVTVVGMFGRIYSALHNFCVSYMTFTVEKQSF